jgi:hypothetical protein
MMHMWVYSSTTVVLNELLGIGTILARHLLGDFVAISTVSMACILFGIIVALYSCYQLALLLLMLVPLAAANSLITFKAGQFDLFFSKPLICLQTRHPLHRLTRRPRLIWWELLLAQSPSYPWAL